MNHKVSYPTSLSCIDPGVSGWLDILPERMRYPALEDALTVDVAIVGAGFAGLSTARRLKQLDPKVRIAVFESRKVAEGPAGRNSGFMIDVPHHLGSEDYTGSIEDDKFRIEMNREAIDFAKQAVDEFSMPQGTFELSGKINGAATDAGHCNNQSFARHLDRLGERYQMLDENDMHKITGSSHYLSGVANPGTAMIQPALYVSELAKGIHSSGVRIFELTPVLDLKQEGDSWRLTTADASVSAGTVVFANNGLVEHFGFFKRRLMHIYLYASMTRQLSHEEVQTLGGHPRWGLTPSHPYGTTVRRISDIGGDRIVIRNCMYWRGYTKTAEKRLKRYGEIHVRTLRQRFPQLDKVTMEYSWGGLLCLSRNSAPAFGELDSNLYSACCQNGLGTTNGTSSGKAIAEMISGHGSASAEFLKLQPQPQRLPPEPFASIGARCLMRWNEFKAGKEK